MLSSVAQTATLIVPRDNDGDKCCKQTFEPIEQDIQKHAPTFLRERNCENGPEPDGKGGGLKC